MTCDHIWAVANRERRCTTCGETWGWLDSLPRRPDNETGLYLRTHRHDWFPAGFHRWESGEMTQKWSCPCGSIIATEAAKEWGCIRAGREIA